ncbi:MAG: hypothetical protein ACI9KN_002119 [Gammaproteobacteria bacterium]|jgi:hypothetical protein
MIYHLQQWAFCLKHCAKMCLLASSPERLPNSIHCIALSLISYLLLGLLLVDGQRSYLQVFGQILLELGLLALITYVGLRLKKALPRMGQTLSALVGVNLLMTAISIPVYRLVIDNNVTGESLSQIEINLALAIIAWNLAVVSLIFKRAFDIGTLVSAMITFNYFMLYQFLIIVLH